jgi:hypothetical protein
MTGIVQYGTNPDKYQPLFEVRVTDSQFLIAFYAEYWWIGRTELKKG